MLTTWKVFVLVSFYGINPAEVLENQSNVKMTANKAFKPKFNSFNRAFVTLRINQTGKLKRQTSNFAVPFSFGVLGDIGGKSIPPHTTGIGRKVASSFKNWSRHAHPTFTAVLGDNFYMLGVNNVTDPRFQTTFENLYNDSSMNFIPWYIVAGNHDHYGNLTAQMVYGQKSKWHYPSLFYTVIYEVQYPPPSSFNGISANEGIGKRAKFMRKFVQLVMIDTVVMCHGVPFKMSPESHKYINTRTRRRQDSWLRTVLELSKAEYLFVAGHYPIYSSGNHGPSRCLERKLLPLLRKSNVTAYLSGHDHNFQHFATNESSRDYLNFIVIGSGAKLSRNTLHMKSNPLGFLKHRYDGKGGFGTFELVTRTKSISREKENLNVVSHVNRDQNFSRQSFIPDDDSHMIFTFRNTLGQEMYKFNLYERQLSPRINL